VQFPKILEGIASGGIYMRTNQELADRIERFNDKAIEDIIIEEQNINPHKCDHAPNYLIPIDTSFDPITQNQIIIQKCVCCNAEVIDQVQGNNTYSINKNYIYQFMDESYMN
jgi:hypothetical protein